MRTALLLLTALAACTTTNAAAPPPVTDTVSCPATAVAPTMPDYCNISTTCSDGSKYVLVCYSDANNDQLSCRCAIDDVVADAITIIGASCTSASQLAPKQLERAWLDCGVDLTLPQ